MRNRLLEGWVMSLELCTLISGDHRHLSKDSRLQVFANLDHFEKKTTPKSVPEPLLPGQMDTKKG